MSKLYEMIASVQIYSQNKNFVTTSTKLLKKDIERFL